MNSLLQFGPICYAIILFYTFLKQNILLLNYERSFFYQDYLLVYTQIIIGKDIIFSQERMKN
jgi:hypothetical protein